MDKTQKLGRGVDAELKRLFKPESVDAVRGIILSLSNNMDDTDKAALGLSAVPIAGDIAGLANDARHWAEDRAAGQPWGATDYALSAAGLLPVVPAGSVLRKMIIGSGAARRESQTQRLAREGARDGLDMSKKARMERARQMGFNYTAFHGTPAPFSGREFRKTNDFGHHFGTRAAANQRLSDLGLHSGGHVGEFMLRVRNPQEVPDPINWLPEHIPDSVKRGDSNAIIYKNAVEDRGSVSFMMMDPKDIRHVDAAFDPKKTNSADILAGVGALSAAPFALSARDERKRNLGT